MDISNLTKNLGKGLEQKTNVELTALSRVLDIALGKVTIAQVAETIPVTPQERQALLNKTAEALQQLNKSATSSPLTPAAKEEISRLLEQQTLIKSPDLKWVNLLVNNRQLLTYSDKPLAAGQTVTVRLVTPEKLVLLDLPESDSSDVAKLGTGGATPARPASSPTYSTQSLTAQSQPAPALSSQALSSQAASVETLPAKPIPSGDSPQQKNSAGTTTENPESIAAIKSMASSAARAQTASIQVAVVTETAPITPEERQELLKKTSEELLQLSKMAQSIPGLKQAISSLLQQQALIKSPDTKWVHLSLDNQTLLTYSDKPLAAGQPVAVQVVTPQKILLLDMPELDGSESADSKLKLLTDTINLALASAKNLTPTYFARLAAAEQTNAPATEENPANGVAAKNTAAAAPLKIHMATVTETAPLLAEERTELLKKTSEELAQLSKMASSNSQPIPGLKEAINSLLQQQVLIKSPAAKWIHLQVGKQSLLTYSDKPLAAGQAVPVQAVTPQKILLLDSPEQTIADNKLQNATLTSETAPQKNATPTYFAKLTVVAPSSIHGDSAEESSEQPPANSIATKNIATATAVPAKIQMAVITETAPLRPDEREELLKKTTEELVQLNKISSTTPGVKEAIASLLQQQALIKSPDTKWVHLSLNNQSLLTYSDKPLTAGQALPVQVISPQKIVLLDLPESNIKILSESINAALANPKNLTPTYFARLAVAIAAAEHSSLDNLASEESSATTAAIKTSPPPPQPQPKIQLATVTQAIPLTAEDRQELLKKTSEELLQLNKMLSATRAVAPPDLARPDLARPDLARPEIKEAIVSLLQQQALIKSPEAKWIHLQVNNQTLLTYSDKPLATGQTVPMQVITPEKIQLLDLIKNSETAAKTVTENLATTLAAQKNSTPTYFATLALTQQLLKPQDTPTPIVAKDAAPAAAKIEAGKTENARIDTVRIETARIETARIETATILKTAPVNPQQRQELLQKISEDLNQLNKLASTSAPTLPSVKELISSLLEQQALLKSPNLKWLELSLNNRPITTYSEKLLSPGQTIPVQLTATQTLAILDSADLAVADDPTIISTTTKNTTQPDTKPPEKFLAKAELPEVQPRPEPLPPAASQWQNTPSLTQELLSPKTVEQALKSVAEKIRSQLQLNPASASLEQGKKAGNESSSPAAIAQPQSSSAKALATTPALADIKSPGNTADNRDSKNGQTQLLEEIDQVLSGTQKKLSIELTAKLLQELIKTPVATPAKLPAAQLPTSAPSPTAQATADLEPLLQQLLSKPANDSTTREARAQLLQLMQLDPETAKNMDIGKLTQHLNKGLEQRNNAELTALNRALNITLGKVVMADVTETAPVTPQERKELLAKTTEALTQLNKLASTPAQLTPALKAEIAQLLEQQALIKSPELKWANLLVNNRPVLTYTDKPLTAGQAVPVQLVDAQKLVLLNLPSQGVPKDPATNSLAASSANSAAPTYSAKLATTALLTELEKNIGTGKPLPADASNTVKPAALTPPSTSRPAAEFTTQKLDPQHIKQVVADNLRRLLPYKDTPDVLLSALTQWQKLPAASQQRLAPVTVEQALKSVAEQIRSPLQIIQPKVLAQIIKHSGVFFENALHKSQAATTSDSPSANLTSTDTAKTPSSGNSPSVAQTYTQDLKGSLLTLLSKVNQELTGSNKPLTEEQTGKLLQQLSSYTANPGLTAATSGAANFAKNTLPVDIGMFIQQVMTKPVKELSDKELRSHLLVLLQQHSVHSLAKIQLQQLANLNNEMVTKDPSQPTASWQVEIPVRHHNEVQQLQLRIDREWVEEKNSSAEDKTVAKVKQWSVTLRFDLPTLGEFCAQLAIIDTSVSATLWASEEKTFGQVRKQMEDLRKNLEKEGINVKQLQCMKGMPAQKPMALSYSLIDIST